MAPRYGEDSPCTAPWGGVPMEHGRDLPQIPVGPEGLSGTKFSVVDVT